MNFDRDLEKIALQEKRLKFKYFDSEVAWALGNALKTAAEKRHVAVAIDIQLNGHTLFSYAMTGTTPDNWELDSSQAQRCPALSLQFFRYRIKTCARSNHPAGEVGS